MISVKGKLLKAAAASAAGCLVLSAAAGCMPERYSGQLIINEVMSKNTTYLSDASGSYPDWVELYNPGSKSISLSDWFISDDELNPDKYNLPDVTIEPGGYIVVFCDGEDRYDPETGEIHANFGISASGEKLFLMSRSGKLNSVELGESLSNISYGRVQDGSAPEDTYMWFAAPTPGKANEGAYSVNAADVAQEIKSSLLITEYSAYNGATLPAPDGGYYGYVTVKNISDEEIVLGGYCLSDNANKPDKWHFPSDIRLGAGETLKVWCSGTDTSADGFVTTNFKFNYKDDNLVLSLAGTTVQSISVAAASEGVCGVMEEGDAASFKYRRISGVKLFDTPEEACTVESIGVCINEVSAVKGNGASEEYDWIELYNATGTDVDLTGWSISDSEDDRTKFVFEDKVIKAGGYVLVYCAGESPKSTKKNSLYADFKLSTAGETLYLINEDSVAVDVFTTGKLRSSVTSGRAVNGTGERVFFKTPTPGKENAAESCSGYTFNPVLSHDGGFVSPGTEVHIASQEGGVTYRYTTDGSIPTSSSPEFRGITLRKNTVLRVKAFKEGKISSDVVTATYLMSDTENTSLPVVSLVSDPDGLFSEENGIFAFGPSYSSSFPYTGANFWKDWEREANFEYYVGGEKVLSVLAGIKIFGQYSRAYDQKSVAVYFRGDYGTKSVTYPFFEDSDHDTLTSLVLRAGGQDQGMTRIRDAYCSQVIKGYTSLVFQEWTPIAVYINGEYYGLYGLREKINAEWLGMYAGVDGNNVDLIKGNRSAKSGTNEAWLALTDYVKSHDLSVDEYYDYVCSQVDVDNFIEWLATEIFFCNGDTGNIKFYRERSDTGKWRWIFYDLDMTLRNEALWNSYNAFEKLFNPAGHGSNNSFSTALQCGLMKNSEFRDKFAKRFAELLNTAFMPENMKAELDRMIDLIDGEMERHCERWGKPATYDDWREEVDNLYRIIAGRRDHVKEQLIEFLDLTDAEVAELFPQG